jgi:hypothetical protein
MKVLIALMVLAIAVPAFAGTNPNIRAFVTFDPADYVHSTYPAPGFVPTYICVDCFGEGGGLTGFSAIVRNTWGGFVGGSADVTIFHPNAQTVIGAPDNVTDGWVVAAPECVLPGPEGIICIANIPYYYLGTPGEVLIEASPVDGKATVDCNNDLDFFCVLSNGGVGMEPVTPGDEDCDCNPNPVEDNTWGGIKALYR